MWPKNLETRGLAKQRDYFFTLTYFKNGDFVISKNTLFRKHFSPDLNVNVHSQYVAHILH